MGQLIKIHFVPLKLALVTDMLPFVRLPQCLIKWYWGVTFINLVLQNLSPFHVFWIFSGPDEAVFTMEQCEQKYGGYLIENVAEIEVTSQNKTTYH